MVTVKRVLLKRRRIDPWLLGLAAVLFPLYLPGPVGVGGIFGICGLYVALSDRDRLVEHLRSAYGFVIVYCLWSLLLITYRGELEAGNRQLGFMLLLLLFSFIAPGLCLIRRPLRTLVLGARIGSLAALACAVGIKIYFWNDLDRYSGGGNAAIVAILVLLGAVVATIEMDRPPKALPNGIHYLALCSFPIFLTETRAVLVLVPVLFFAEFFLKSLDWPSRIRNRSYAVVLAGIAVLLFVPPIQHMLADRFVTVYEYYVNGTQNKEMISGDIRLTMWASGLTVIRHHLLTGVGTMDMFTYMKAVAGPSAGLIEGFKHVHNFVLQELLANGIVGLVLLLSIPVAFLTTVIRNAPNASIKRCAFYFYGSIAVFGLLHDPFYHELCMTTNMLFFGVHMAQFQRWNLLSPMAQKRV